MIKYDGNELLDTSNMEYFTATMNLRWIRTKLGSGRHVYNPKLQLQQKWQGSKGTIKWEFVDIVEDED